MSIIPDELKTQHFPCPSCGKFINDEVVVCHLCSTTITSQMREIAIDHERREKRSIRIRNEKRTLIMGVVILATGLVNMFVPTFDLSIRMAGRNIPCLSTIAVVLGIGVTLIALRGYTKEAWT